MNNIPKHIGFVLDGNRRFAKKLKLEPWKGHELGGGKVKKLLKWGRNKGIKEFTFYCLSIENMNRDKEELDFLLNIFRKEFKNLSDSDIHEHKIKVSFIGRLHLLPSDLAEQCRKLEEETKDYNQFKINFAIAYGGRQEITDAVKKIIGNISTSNLKPEDITEDFIADHLYMKNEPDMIIRTGNEKRTSNFLPWQAIYSEWFFLDKMWPEFNLSDLKKCLTEFQQREIRRGK